MKLPGRQHLAQKRIFWRRTTFFRPNGLGITKSPAGTWEAPVPAVGGGRNADGHRFGKQCAAVGTVMPTLFPLT